VLDEGTVPEEAEKECAEEHQENEHDEGLDHLLKGAALDDSGKHLLCTQKKKMTDCSNEQVRCFQDRGREGVRD